MIEWRPEGWFGVIRRSSDWDYGYEAGADAMLTALRASVGGHHISPSDNDIPCKLPELWPGLTGYVVFIPDAKD